MSVVKNFGFGHPLIKTSAASRPRESGIGPVDTHAPGENNGSFWSSRFSALSANGRDLSLRDYEAWCRRQRDALDGNGAEDEETGVNPSMRRYRSYMAGREFARRLGLKSGAEWRRFVEGEMRHLGDCPPDIPMTPQRAYRNEGWTGYADWLGLADEI